MCGDCLCDDYFLYYTDQNPYSDSISYGNWYRAASVSYYYYNPPPPPPPKPDGP
jgi:hypothetical protein